MTKLKEKRVEKGLTQQELSLMSDVSLNMIRKYEQGTRDINKANTLTIFNLAIALNCNIIDFVTDDKIISALNKYESRYDRNERQHETEYDFS